MENKVSYDRIEQAIHFLAAHHKEQPTLEAAAEHVHLSPFHFQRMFTEWVGISPKKFVQYLTVDYLKSRIHTVGNMQEAAEVAGLSAQSRVYDLFVTLEAVTPNQFKQHGAGMTIRYGLHETPFGTCLLAATEKGICEMSFAEDSNESELIDTLHQKWENAQIVEDKPFTAPFIAKIFGDHSQPPRINLLVKGTNFQVKVWEALLRIPHGALATYQHIAQEIGHPKAVRAVGTAVGKNPVAYLIPCHRVIRKEGIIGKYRWGTPRKQALIGWEMAHAIGTVAAS